MKYISLIVLSLPLLCISCKKETVIWQGITYETISTSETPFPMSDVQIPVFPDRGFDITDYGARPMPHGGYPTAIDSSRIIRTNSQAFERAMEVCSGSGGGHVVVPKGEWLTGPIRFQSNCDLFLSDGAEVIFSRNPDDFLPEQMTSWEGIECYNYSPLVYAWRCNNIGISGSGTFRPLMDVWEKWYEPTFEHLKALQMLDNWGTFGALFYARNISGSKFRLRPALIQFYQCSNILLQDFKVRQSPHWAIHLFNCEEGMARRLDIVALGRDNDGIDLEMTRHFIVEDCSFDQGGDAIAIKSGRVLENWNTPNSSRYIVIRRCVANRAKAFLSIGEEISHGVHNVYMHNCQAKGELDDFFSIRSNRRQNSQVDSITVEHCEAASLQRIFAIDTDVYGDWRGRMTSGPDSCVATIAGITMRDIKCRRAVALVDINGDAKRPVKDVTIEDLNADSVTSFLSHTTHVIDYKPSAIRARHLGQSSLQPRRPQ